MLRTKAIREVEKNELKTMKNSSLTKKEKKYHFLCK